MKIYHVQFQSLEYENDERFFSVIADTVVDAVDKALEILRRQINEEADNFDDYKWEIVKVELSDTIDE